MQKIKCFSCFGGGKIQGMGYIWQDCPNCEGKGYLYKEDEVKAEIKKIEEAIVMPEKPSEEIKKEPEPLKYDNPILHFATQPEKKKPGRPKSK